ncbi:MAG: hypothetical protein MJE12_24735, partial [Alphaproteobacteria bacterium]|nr:hypothetical protein [Alphaproteobacteria bacterium]
AQRFVELIEGRAPDAWFFEADDIRYVQGVGGPEAKIAERIRNLVDALGPASLCLDDKPALRDRMINFARAQWRDEAA